MEKPSLAKARCRNKDNVEYKEFKPIVNKELFNGKKYFLKTYGCQMNEHDSELIANLVENIGFEPASKMEEADLVILNTCAIRENAHDKVFGFLGRCKHEKEKNNKDMIISLAGCMAEEPIVVEEILSKHKYIDLVFGPNYIQELPNYLMNLTDKTSVHAASKEGDVIEGVDYTRDSKITAWVNIMYGCDKFCTYCIVPYTRGMQRSRKSNYIINEVKKLKKDGYKEVTLLGQNVNAYGKDLDNEISFASLLEEVAKTKIDRVRFVTSHPWDFTDEMIDIISKYENIMPYIHLPIQSGSDEILRKMGRRYTKEEYLTLYKKIKEKIPDAAVTTDIIVGFPGETEKDFNETLDVVKKCKYDGAFTFIYSKRDGTPAAKMPDDVSEEEKKQRLYRLNELINKYSLESNKKLLNKIEDVLITNKSTKGDNVYIGYTKTNKLVNVSSKYDIIGKIVNVKIKEAKSFNLDGVVLNEISN